MANTLVNTDSQNDLTDKEIILACINPVNEVALRQTQFEFYRRFAPYILKIALKACYNFIEPENFAKEITQLTFISAFKKITEFKICEDLENKAFQAVIKSWLGKIANNNFLKLCAKNANKEVYLDDLQFEEPSFDPFSDLINSDKEEFSIEMDLLQTALKQLKEKDIYIILTYASENCLTTTNHISDGAMKMLCETYNTTPDNIRQRKHRALNKIKSLCLKI